MRNLLTFVQLFTFADWIIAAFISGTAARIQSRVTKIENGEIVHVPTGKRTPLAVGLATFFGLFALIRVGEFANIVHHAESLRAVLSQVPKTYTASATIMAGFKTLALLFCWFAVTIEVRERKGIASGNVIRNWLARLFDKLR